MRMQASFSVPASSQHPPVLSLGLFLAQRRWGVVNKPEASPPTVTVARNGVHTTPRIRLVGHCSGPASRNPFSCPSVREGGLSWLRSSQTMPGPCLYTLEAPQPLSCEVLSTVEVLHRLIGFFDVSPPLF